MIFLADECIDQPIINILRDQGHTVYSILEDNKGVSDTEVLAIAHDKNAILITIDKDFGELIYRKQMISQGVILIRLSGLPNAEKAVITSNVVKDHINEIQNAFTVINSQNVRIRTLKS